MRANILTDAALTKHAGQFAWLSIDIDKDTNAPFLGKFPVEGTPAFLIIDGGTERVVLKWLGTASLTQLENLLDDARRASSSEAAASDVAPADLALARADRLNGERK